MNKLNAMKVRKERAINRFVSEIRSSLGDNISAILLYGSTAKDIAKEESDIDILIVYSGIDEQKVLEVASEISFKIACEENELIEVVAMSEEEYNRCLGRSPFLFEVLEFGKPLYTILSGTDWELDFSEYLELAKEYLDYSEDALKEGKIRLAVDVGYNACELLVKALIISKRESLASSPGGIVGQFGRLFVLNGEIPENLGRDLNLALELRAKARYRPKSQLKEADAQFVVNLARELLTIAQKRL